MSENLAVHREMFNMMCDDLIGYGSSRKVFSSKVVPGTVIKVEEGAASFQNVIEWETWLRVKGTGVEQWFAPCRFISPCGSILIMERTTPATDFPPRMPVFLTDYKRTNYGIFNGRFVCHDYGTHGMFESGMSKRLRKAGWWDV